MLYSSVYVSIPTKLLIISFWLYWLETYKVQSKNMDELKLWKLNSEIDARKSITTPESRNKSGNEQFWYTHGKPRKRSTKLNVHDSDHIGGHGVTHSDLRSVYRNDNHEAHHKGARNIHHNNDRHHKTDLNHNRDKKQLDQELDINEWPKSFQRKLRRSKPVSNKHRSTKITPMYLMQKQDEEKENKPSKSEENKRQNDETIILTSYSITDQIEKIMSKFPHANMSTTVIERTIEYNDILLLKITEKEKSKYFRADGSKYTDEIPEKNIVFIVHGLSIMGIHSLSCLWDETYFAKLLSFYLVHLDKFDIFLIPMANPDGYQASASLWNKNLSPQDACSGVALDRNFDVAWNGSKYISSCSQQYPGPAPFSEPETQAIREVFHDYSHKIIAYLHVHSGTYSYDTFKGDAVLYPRGYTEMQSDDDKYIDLKGEIDEAIKNANFRAVSVTVDTLYNWYGKVYGTSVDYASTVYGIPYAMELVMQLYENEEYIKIKLENEIDYIALTEIWGRVINVIFNNIWRNTQVNDVRR